MSDYTPSDQSVRIAYVFVDESSKQITEMRKAAFDSWMSEHDRQVAERAWDACVEHVEAILGGDMKRAAHADNPYRAAKGEQK